MNQSVSTETAEKRSLMIDLLKGISIVAVVLYHFSGTVLPYGYLGVDIFLVIGGYLMLRTILRKFQEDSFHYWDFIFEKY